jgi:hypothetical protein
MKDDPVIGHCKFADGAMRPIYDDGRRQYVIDDDGYPVYGVWLISEDAPNLAKAWHSAQVSTMERRVCGTYVHYESRHVSSRWAQICADHEEEFPEIRQCFPGTFNIALSEQYLPPNEAVLRKQAKMRGQSVGRYVDGNHVSPHAKVVEINGKPVEAWIYRGGHLSRPVLELLSRLNLAEHLQLADGAVVNLSIFEYPDGIAGMPGPPPETPGKLVNK